MMKRLMIFLFCSLWLAACAANSTPPADESSLPTETEADIPLSTISPSVTPDPTEAPFILTLSDLPVLEIEGLSSGSFIYGYAVFDIDHDGLDDLIYGGPKWSNQDGGFINDPAEITVLLNRSKEGFVFGNEVVFPQGAPTLVHARDARAADLNGDGMLDVYFAGTGYDNSPYPGEENLLILSQADGFYFNASGQLDNPVFGFSHSAAIGDVDNDEDVDLVVVDIWSGNSPPAGYLLVNDGSGQFSTSKIIDVGSSIRWTASELVDLNNDGYLDLVVGSHGSGTPSLVLWNPGDGQFGSQYIELPSADPYMIVVDIAAIDLNGDGYQDLIFSSTQDDPAYSGRYLHVLINQQGEEFATSDVDHFPDLDIQGTWIMRMETIDIDLDGDLDLVTLYDLPESSKTQIVWLNDGEGIFHLLSLPQEVRGTMIPIDVDNDGDKDFLVLDVSNFGNQDQIQRWRVVINNTR